MSSNKAEGNVTISFVNRQKHDNLSAIVNKGIVCQMIIKTIVERYVIVNALNICVDYID